MSFYGSTNHGVAIQPCGDGNAMDHYEITVRGGYDPEPDAAFFDPANLRIVRDLVARHERIALWGLTRGTKKASQADSNPTKWRALEAGTLVAFVNKNQIISAGVVLATFQDERAAAHIWTLKENQPFEFMYVLGEVAQKDIALGPLFANNPDARGANKEKPAFQALQFPTAMAAEVLIDALGAATPARVPGGVGRKGATDTDSRTSRRLEQQELKLRLLQECDQPRCSLCQIALPVEFLRAAHIKKRSACSEDERNDLPFVGMLACRFGCDDLFELGYVGIDPGTGLQWSVMLPPTIRTLPQVATLTSLTGLLAPLTNPQRRDYFRWHMKNTFRRPV